jgi:hypothetical protein
MLETRAIWEMIKEAVDSLNGKASYSQIKDYILKKWGEKNQNTVNAQIITLSVNVPSRVHYPNNKKPRIADGPYDLLYSVGAGQVVRYNPAEHGVWEIYEKEFGGLGVQQIINDGESDLVDPQEENNPLLFPLEANLRDFLIKNLHTVKDYDLKLFVEPKTNRDGKEFPTDVGNIDILAEHSDGTLVVFELKLSRGPDRALGQLLRYMGWVKAHLAKWKECTWYYCR